MKQQPLSIEEKVAQLFVLGSDTVDLEEEIEPFYRYGLGGLILFRHHLQPFSTSIELREFLNHQKQKFHGGKLSFIGIDQEGGQVERLPHWLFPSGILPVALGLKNDPLWCEQINREIVQRLRWMGFNLNFAPTVDLNREWKNPIIGVRAFGETPEQVIPFARTIVKTHMDKGVLPVAKHFPGHGSGIVDSHISVPIFDRWSDTELEPYRVLIKEKLLPAVLIAHGVYPSLMKNLNAENLHLPASLSRSVATNLLREKMGFKGLIFTDDMMMGAIINEFDPIEAALHAFEAGADMLIYRRTQPEAWYVFKALVSRFQQGKLSETMLDEKVQRILKIRDFLSAIPAYDYSQIAVSEEACHQLALQWAQQGIVELHHQFVSPLPFSHRTSWGLVVPDVKTMKHYQPDIIRGKGLLEWLQHYGISPSVSTFYSIEEESTSEPSYWADSSLENIVFIAFNSHMYPAQQKYYEDLKNHHPAAKIILASCGMPSDREVLSKPWIHVQLPSFRPAAMQAFVQWLITSPSNRQVHLINLTGTP